MYSTTISDVLSSFGPTTTVPSSSLAVLGGSNFFTTVSAWSSEPYFLPDVTDTEPSSATTIFASCGKLPLAVLTASSTARFSSVVNDLGSFT